MAMYNPPKGNNWGEALQLAGTATAGAGGILTASGVGAPIGIGMAAVGGIASLIGGVLGNNEQEKLADYNRHYQARVTGERNLSLAIQNNKEVRNSINNIQSLAGIND